MLLFVVVLVRVVVLGPVSVVVRAFGVGVFLRVRLLLSRLRSIRVCTGFRGIS